MLRSLLEGAASGAALVEKVVTGEVSNVVASLTTDTTMAPVAAPYSPFNSRIGDERTVRASTWSKSRIRAVQDKAAVTGNDVVLAVIAGVLRSWLLDRGELPEQSLVTLCPITVRGHEHGPDNGHGNQFGLGCARWAPISTPRRTAGSDPSVDVGRKAAGGRARLGRIATALVPTLALTVLLPKVPFAPKVRTGYNVPISNVPGPVTEMYWNGAHVEEIYHWNGLRRTHTNRHGVLIRRPPWVQLSTSPDVMPNIGEVIELTERSLAELEAAVGVAR